jgi:hypothetical protein
MRRSRTGRQGLKPANPSRASEQGLLWRLSPEAFEHWVGDRLVDGGYQVELTRYQGDHGVDLIATSGEVTMLVQCKHHSGKTIGEPVLRDLFGALHHFRVDRGLLVTTGKLSAPARRWLEGKGIAVWDAVYLAEHWPEDASRYSSPPDGDSDRRRVGAAQAGYLYTDDSGRRWRVVLPRKQGDHPLLGFQPALDESALALPADLHMRYCNWGGSLRRSSVKGLRTPVGSIAAVAEIFRGNKLQWTLPDGSEADVPLSSYRGEDTDVARGS